MRVGLIIFDLFLISLLIVLPGCLAKADSSSRSKLSKSQERTFISEIIGFSAFKFLLILAVPLVFSIFLGAMLVLLFPFPLLTSTTGLAGAAAIGRRQGKSDNSMDEEYQDILEYLGVTDPVIVTGNSRVMHYNHNNNNNHHQSLNSIYSQPSSSNKSTLKQLGASGAATGVKFNEKCLERIACEIGRSAGSEFRSVVNQVINDLPIKDQQKWKSTIHAYLQGSQSQVLSAITQPQIPLQPLNQNYYQFGHHHPHQKQGQQQQYVRNLNLCPKYKCRL